MAYDDLRRAADIKRRAFLVSGAGAVLLVPQVRANAANRAMTVYRTPTCSCCKAWVTHIESHGFSANIVELEDLLPIKQRAGVPEAHESCHTTVVEGYFIEGHVPAADILRLLDQKPLARGLSVPGMPVGSPGMEVPGIAPDSFQTLLIASDGSARLRQALG